MKNHRGNKERGVALISVLLILLLLLVLAFGLMYMSDTDTAINLNYRREQQAYFAAKAGIEEVRDRMRRTAPHSLDAYPPLVSLLPTTVAADTGGVLYVINQGADPTLVEPWTAGSRYQDDELCHDGYVLTGIPNPFIGGVPSDNVRCPNPPSGPATWYTKPVAGAPTPGWETSWLPFRATAAAVPYKWVRVTWKQNNSIQGTTAQPYTVDGTTTNSSTAATPVCWDGKKEVLLQSPATICEQMPTGMRPVYLATSLAITGGSRRMVQAELAKTMIPTVPAALALDGPEPNFTPMSSNNGTVIGHDLASTPCPPAGNWPAVGTYDDYDATQVANKLLPGAGYGAKPGNWTGGPSNTTGFNAINIGPWGPYKDGTTGTTNANCPGSGLPPYSPFCPGMSGNLNQLFTKSGLQDLVNTITQSADTIVPAGSAPSLPMGTDTDPKITVIQGDFNYSGNAFIGAGILLVQGKVTISGTPTFDGILYIIGEGYLQTSGTAGYGGSVFIANINHAPNPPSGGTLAILAAQGLTGYPSWVPGNPTYVGGGGGGSGGVNYNSCKANLGNDRIPYRTLATREILY